MSDKAERVYEQLLVLPCQMGSEAAFAEVVERYSPRLRYYVRKWIGSTEDAEDALQEVWADVYRC